MNHATTVKENQSISVDSRAGKYLTFFLASEEYGVEILKVQEIIERMPITPVPLTSKEIPTLTANAVFLKKTSIISMKVSVSFRKCSEQNSLLI
ncbi:MAG: chemotaxis protein CheW [Smithella sp.]|nr:chemotaxis protein CheW [Smithella sp.]